MKSKTKTKRKKIETALLFWLNSGNENATQGAYLIERALKNKCAHNYKTDKRVSQFEKCVNCGKVKRLW